MTRIVSTCVAVCTLAMLLASANPVQAQTTEPGDGAWRGWVRVEHLNRTNSKLVTFAGEPPYEAWEQEYDAVPSAGWIDIDPTSFTVEWLEDFEYTHSGYDHSCTDVAYKQSVGRATGTGSWSMSSGGTSTEPLATFQLSASPVTVPMEYRQHFCTEPDFWTSTEQRMPRLAGIIGEAGVPPTPEAPTRLAARYGPIEFERFQSEDETRYHGVQLISVCMTKDDADSDGDGLPDEVDTYPHEVTGIEDLIGKDAAFPHCPIESGDPDSPDCPATGLMYGDVMYDEVYGPPSYGDGQLDAFPNTGTMCSALWLPLANEDFVPQGLALDGQTAWVSGYEPTSAGTDNGPCQLVRVDLETGAAVGEAVRSIRKDGERCIHGGGLGLTSHGLWIADTDRLWLLDPGRIGSANPVQRFWKLKDPVKGSFLVDSVSGQIGLGVFEGTGKGEVHWFRYSHLFRSDEVKKLIPQESDAVRPDQARAVRTSPAPRKAQGADHHTRDTGSTLWFTSSTAGCGMLEANANRVGFGPGAEEIEFQDADTLWAVFESGSMHFQNKGRPFVPMLASFDVDPLLTGDSEICSW